MGDESMMRKFLGAVATVSMLMGGAALAEETAPAEAAPTVAKPPADAVKAVWEFFYKGKGSGVVLGDVKVCTEVGREGETKNECTKEAGPEGVKAGTNVIIWQAYLVPFGDAVEDITVQLKQGETVRETKDVKVKGEAARTRTWTYLRLPKPGEWTVTIARGGETLKTLNIKANK